MVMSSPTHGDSAPNIQHCGSLASPAALTHEPAARSDEQCSKSSDDEHHENGLPVVSYQFTTGLWPDLQGTKLLLPASAAPKVVIPWCE